MSTRKSDEKWVDEMEKEEEEERLRYFEEEVEKERCLEDYYPMPVLQEMVKNGNRIR